MKVRGCSPALAFEALEEIRQAPAAEPGAGEEVEGAPVRLGFRFAPEGGAHEVLPGPPDRSGAEIAEQNAEQEGEAEPFDHGRGGMAVDDVPHLVGQHAGHLVRGLGEAQQALRDQYPAAREGEGVVHLQVHHPDPEVVWRITRGEAADQCFQRLAPGAGGAQGRSVVAVEQGKVPDHRPDETPAERGFPLLRHEPGGAVGKAWQREPCRGQQDRDGSGHESGPAQPEHRPAALARREPGGASRELSDERRVRQDKAGRAAPCPDAKRPAGLRPLVDRPKHRVAPEGDLAFVPRIDDPQPVRRAFDRHLQARGARAVVIASQRPAHGENPHTPIIPSPRPRGGDRPPSESPSWRRAAPVPHIAPTSSTSASPSPRPGMACRPWVTVR